MPKAAVLGSPIAHSKSPLLHAAAYRALDLAWTYDRHEVVAHDLVSFLAEHAGEYRGLSLTMPLKERAFELADEVDEPARATKAVNTLIFGDRLRGYNTDVVGFMAALKAAHIPVPEEASILGTGATARSAAYALVKVGTRVIHIVGRRVDALAEFDHWLSSQAVDVVTHMWDEHTPSTSLTISTTVAGATDGRPLPQTLGVLFDCIYAPWPTEHAARWRAAGGQVLNGLDLLVQQAAEQFLLMTRVHPENREAVVEAMYGALRGLPA